MPHNNLAEDKAQLETYKQNLIDIMCEIREKKVLNEEDKSNIDKCNRILDTINSLLQQVINPQIEKNNPGFPFFRPKDIAMNKESEYPFPGA